MSTLMTAIVIVAVVVVLLMVFNRKALRRIFESGNAQVSKVGRALWEQDPQAIIQHRIDEATEEIRSATTALEENKALVNSLNRQVADGKREVALLDARVRNSLLDDPDDKNGKAGVYVQQLQTAQTALATNEGQLERVTAMYQNNLKKIQAARGKIKEAEDRARQIGIELKMAKTEAAIGELSAKCNINIKSVDGLSEAEELARRQIDKYKARGEVATDMGTDGLAEIEEEERLKKAEGAALLEQYKANMKK